MRGGTSEPFADHEFRFSSSSKCCHNADLFSLCVSASSDEPLSMIAIARSRRRSSTHRDHRADGDETPRSRRGRNDPADGDDTSRPRRGRTEPADGDDTSRCRRGRNDPADDIGRHSNHRRGHATRSTTDDEVAADHGKSHLSFARCAYVCECVCFALTAELSSTNVQLVQVVREATSPLCLMS